MNRTIKEEIAYCQQFARDAEFERDTWKARVHDVERQRYVVQDELDVTRDALAVERRRFKLLFGVLRSSAFTPEESNKIVEMVDKTLASDGLDMPPKMWCCAYCKSPGIIEDIQAHIKVCEKHPLANALKEVERLRALLNKALTYVDESVKDEWAREAAAQAEKT